MPNLDPIIVNGSPENMSTSLSLIRSYVLEAAIKAGLPKQAQNRLRLAVDEIATNIILHGYGEGNIDGDLKVNAAIDDKQLTITLEDTATPYDPRSQEPPNDMDAPLDKRETGGLGVYLALRNVDAFNYDRADNCNINRLVMNRIAE